MVSVNEIRAQQSALESALRQGLESIDRNQTVTFSQYTKIILPADGYIFWLKNGTSITVKGSLHYSTEEVQDETETLGRNRVLFTSEQEIQALNSIAPNIIWIGSVGDAAASAGDIVQGISNLNLLPILFAFAGRGNFYKAAEIYHYYGTAVLPSMRSQIINSINDLPVEPIVTNSLPIWLAQNQFAPVYPSFLVPNNITPPYIVAHIDPESTVPVQQFPSYVGGFVSNTSPPPVYLPGTAIPNSGISPLYNQPSSQLMSDTVRLTLVGFNNQTALQFYGSLIQYSLNTDAFGFQNSPAIRDDKRTQVELSILQQKKHIDIVASYYQSAADVIAQRLLLSVSEMLTVSTTP